MTLVGSPMDRLQSVPQRGDWSTGGLCALIAVLQLRLAPTRVKERSSGQPNAGGETTAHKRAEESFRMGHSQVERSE